MASDFVEPQWTLLDGSNAQLAALSRQAREAAGYTVAELAARKIISRPTIKTIESGSVSPSITTLTRYAAAIGRSLAISFLDAGHPLPLPSPAPPQWRHDDDAAARVRSLKESLASEILRILEARHLTPRSASRLTGFPQANFTRLRRGNLRRSTMEILIAMLMRLDPEIDVRLCFEPSDAARRTLADSP